MQSIFEVGSPDGTDITMLLRWIASAMPGRAWLIPAGYWNVSGPIVCSTPAVRPPLPNVPISFHGDGPGLTFLVGHTGRVGVPLFTFDASAVPAGYALYGGLFNLTLWSGNEFSSAERGVGVRFQDTVFAGGHDLWIRGYSLGLHSNTCQDQMFQRVQVQACNDGALIENASQLRLDQFEANQNYVRGVVYTGGPCAWTGGLLQGSGTGPLLHVIPRAPGASWLTINDIHVEGDITTAVQIDAAVNDAFGGNVRMDDINWNVQNFATCMRVRQHALALNRWVGGGTWVDASLCAVDANLGADVPGRFILDATTRSLSTWSAPGMIGFGRPPVSGGATIQDRRA